MIIKMPYPVSNNKYYRKYKNVMVLSKEGRQFKEYVQWTNKHLKPQYNDFKLSITIHPRQCKNAQPYKRVIDIDASAKCVLDSLIGILYYDDKQVKELHIYYGEPKKNGATTIYWEILK